MAEGMNYYSGSLAFRVIVTLLCRAKSCGVKISLWFVLIAALLCIYIFHLTAEPAVPSVHSTKSSITSPIQYVKRDRSSRNVTTRKIVLVIYDATSKSVFQKIKILLLAQKVVYETYFISPGKLPPIFSNSPKRLSYSLIIFTSLSIYQHLPSVHKQHYHKYCRNNNVGIIFITHDVSGSIGVGNSAALSLYKFNAQIKNFYVYPTKFLYITKGNINVSPTETNWTFLNVDDGNFVPIASVEYVNPNTQQSVTYPVVLADYGGNDGVRRVFFGCPPDSWIVKLLLLDAIRRFSAQPVLKFGLKRYILVDIDDIFVAPPGTRMKVDDVKALIHAQETFRSKVPGFTFNLGYAGYFYDQGLDEEVKGNKELVKNADKFWWFGHIWNHYQPHLLQTKEQLVKLMKQNYEFAVKHNLLSRTNNYAVAPHHSGVYPVHQPLYDAWAEVWGVTVTSTEEYPHLRPDHMRRGFIHQGLQVLPRQLCNLYTKTYKFEHFATGKEGIRHMAQGGYVFEILVNNPVSIFMTHISNYGNDRLGLFLFEHAVEFIQQYTNLQLVTEPPLELAKIYFNLFPIEKMPLWGSPCADHRHLEIWASGKNCSRLPNFLIVGPQKTGSTALASFLSYHPLLVVNDNNPVTFEEVQFFSDDKNYQKGIEWYMSNFRYPTKNQLLFEKSATYFTHHLAPSRAAELLPEAKIIIILHDPVIRAYSWYQHMRAHSDPMALENSFLSVLQANSSTDDASLVSLRRHCLEPGIYHIHILRWLQHYKPKQIYFVDGTELITDPGEVLQDIQLFLQVTDTVDYSKYLKYSATKKFYCLTLKNGKQKCLGPGKGRHYPTMSREAELLLYKYYQPHNQRLSNLLQELKVSPPNWLHSYN